MLVAIAHDPKGDFYAERSRAMLMIIKDTLATYSVLEGYTVSASVSSMHGAGCDAYAHVYEAGSYRLLSMLRRLSS